MKRVIVTTALLFVAFSVRQAWANSIIIGQSSQNVTFAGQGANSSGDGVAVVSWGDCNYSGGTTTCTVSGTFTGLGPGGTYDFVLTYSGNGTSPLTATSESPGSDAVIFSLSSGSIDFTFNESNGTTVTYHVINGLQFVASLTTCSSNVTPCSTANVGVVPGATITGPLNGDFNNAPTIQTVISAGSYGAFSSVAPATWIEIYGEFLADTKYTWETSDFQGNNAPTALQGTNVTVGGDAAFVDYVSNTQVNVQVPSNVATGSQQLVLTTTTGGSSTPFSVNVNATEPGLLAPAAFDINGTQYAVALFSNGLYDLPPDEVAGLASRRAVPGDTIIIYGIGFGPVSDGTLAGVIDQNTNSLNGSLTVTIGGANAQVQYDGLTPGFVGLYQFNVVVPNISPSDTTPLTFTLNGTAGPQTLNLFVGS